MRLFIAIEFDEQTKANILHVQRQLATLGQGRFTHRENLHLTLAFLGEVPLSRVAAIRRAMDRTAVEALTLVFDHTGRFRREGGDIWWIGLAKHQRLLELQQELVQHLAAEGFALEKRPFTPHITLARQVQLTVQPKEGELLEEPFETKVDGISLMRSQRMDGRLIYTPQYRKKC